MLELPSDTPIGGDFKSLQPVEYIIVEIDNKSLTNRPDLWGHYGIARELAAIYDAPLKELPKYEIPKVPEYSVEIKDTTKCNRYAAVEIDGIYEKPSPM